MEPVLCTWRDLERLRQNHGYDDAAPVRTLLQKEISRIPCLWLEGKEQLAALVQNQRGKIPEEATQLH
jgi:hypothetical protein